MLREEAELEDAMRRAGLSGFVPIVREKKVRTRAAVALLAKCPVPPSPAAALTSAHTHTHTQITHAWILRSSDEDVERMCRSVASDAVRQRQFRRFLRRLRSGPSPAVAPRSPGLLLRAKTMTTILAAILFAAILTTSNNSHIREISSPVRMNDEYLQQSATRPLRVICAGLRRGGSTWQYHAVRLILKIANPDRQLVAQAFSGGKPDDVTRLLTTTPEEEYLVVKVHEYDPRWARAATHVATSHRDPRDVYHSVKRTGMAWEASKNTAFRPRCEITDALCATRAFWHQYERWAAWTTDDGSAPAYDMPYERFASDELGEIQRLIDWLGVPHVSATTVRHGLLQVLRRRRVDAERTWDTPRSDRIAAAKEAGNARYTHMHRDHLARPTPGSGASELSESEIEAVESAFGEEMRALGYVGMVL